MYRLVVLGAGQVLDQAGVPVRPLMQPRPLAVLAVLAVAGAKGATRDRLATLLWGEDSDRHARHNLSDVLYLIHRELGADAVTAAGPVLYLNREQVRTDLDDFAGGLEAGSREAAVATYGGPFLEGFHLPNPPAFEEWLESERRRLAGLFGDALEVLARAGEEAGDYAAAARYRRRLLAEDPLNSPVAVALARVLAAGGDRGNAMEILVAHRALLREELGMDAPAAVADAMADLAAAEPPVQRRPRPASVAAPPAPAERTPGEGPRPPLAPATVTPAPAPAAWWRRPPVPIAFGAAAAAVALGIAAWLLLRSPRFVVTVSDISPVSSEPGVEFQPAISPDGKEVAYAAGPIEVPRLVFRSADGRAAGGEVRLPDTMFTREALPSWSSDGERVRFWGCRGLACAVYETGRLGGAVRRIPVPRGNQGSWSWSPDGTRLALVRADTILVASAGDTAARPIVAHSGPPYDVHSLAWSPDGKRIAFVRGNSPWRWAGNVSGAAILVVDEAGGAAREITTSQDLNVSPVWLDERHLLFISDRDGPRGLYVVEVGPEGRRGEPRAVPGAGDAHSLSFSTVARKLAFAKFTFRQNIRSYPLDPPAPVGIRDGRPVTTGSQVIEAHDVSPDGRWVLFDNNRRGKMTLYRMPLAGGAPLALTESRRNDFQPRWSPDGREIAFHRATGDSASIMVMPAEGGPAVAVTHAWCAAFPSWAPSGLAIAYQSCAGPVIFRILVVSRDSIGGAWRQPVQVTDFTCYTPEWAPDGRTLLCQDNRDLVLVSPQGRLVRRIALVEAGLRYEGGMPRFSPDGRGIYFFATHRDGRRGVWRVPAAGGAPRLVVALDDPALDIPFGSFSFDRSRLYLTVSEYESDIWIAKLHW